MNTVKALCLCHVSYTGSSQTGVSNTRDAGQMRSFVSCCTVVLLTLLHFQNMAAFSVEQFFYSLFHSPAD